MITETIIHFIRHGIVENPEELYYGRLAGFRLAEQGIRQAKAAANLVRNAVAASDRAPYSQAASLDFLEK